MGMLQIRRCSVSFSAVFIGSSQIQNETVHLMERIKYCLLTELGIMFLRVRLLFLT